MKIEDSITKVLDENVLHFHTKTNRDICIIALRMLTESAIQTEREKSNDNENCMTCWDFRDNDCKRMTIMKNMVNVAGKGFYCSCWSKR